VGFSHITTYSYDPHEVQGNVENFIGVAQVPIGIVGPVLVQGDFARGIFYVPFATTEGAIISTYQRGSWAVALSGGVRTRLLKDQNHLDPVFVCHDIGGAGDLVAWIVQHFADIRQAAEQTTGHGRLVSVTPHAIGRRVVLDFAYETGDAVGANMINFATEAACELISGANSIERYYLRSNFSAEKKASATQLLIGLGKEVVAEAIVDRKIAQRYLGATPEQVAEAWTSWALASLSAGGLGINGHFANGLAAIYIATGQDVAHVANGCTGVNNFEVTGTGDLRVTIKLPNLLIGTIGGGTALPTQRECLAMIGCYGEGKTQKFAEIIAATLLTGELGICAGIVSKFFQEPHRRAWVHTREKALRQGANAV
jgi:hydroxymethylglutaryl-CoA reductase (NADPH)